MVTSPLVKVRFNASINRTSEECPMDEAKRKAEKSPYTASLKIHQLVVLEWLRHDEHRTGTNLVKKLRASKANLPVTCIDCWSRQDVLDCIEKLTDDMSESDAKVPILHIEAHGFSPNGDGESAIGIVGPKSQAGGEEILLWSDLAAPLRKLNLATAFNLLFVGAACWSDSSIYTVTASDFLPFMLAIGFSTTVYSNTLELAMVELYENLLIKSHSIQSSLNLAHEKLDTTSEKLAWFSLPLMIKNAALAAVNLTKDPSANEDRYQHMVAELTAAGVAPLARDEFHRRHLTHAPAAIEKILSVLLAYDLLPANRTRFGFDGKRLAMEALDKQ